MRKQEGPLEMENCIYPVETCNFTGSDNTVHSYCIHCYCTHQQYKVVYCWKWTMIQINCTVGAYVLRTVSYVALYKTQPIASPKTLRQQTQELHINEVIHAFWRHLLLFLYMKRKPRIFGIKIILLHGVESGYVHNREIQAHTPINNTCLHSEPTNRLSANEQGAYFIYVYLVS
jgi:hypothetical protein